jgi:hypothetical protein
VRPRLEKIPNSFWESIQQVGISGTPDILGCICGIFVAIEIKTDEGVSSVLQIYKRQRIVEAQGLALVIAPNNFEASIQFLENIAKEGTKHGQRSSIKKGGKRDKTKLQDS